MNVILASTSPRRKELLRLLNISFTIVSPEYEEIFSDSFPPYNQVLSFAKGKAESVATQYPQDLVLGSDTIIEIKGKVLGKPQNLEEAETMLHALRGQNHQVHTALALFQTTLGVLETLVETAQVWIKPFSKSELRAYLDTQESLGKAGAYSIQGEGAKLIEKIEGDYPTIVGLPLWRTAKLLEKQGVKLGRSVEEIYKFKPYGNWKDF